MVDIGKEIIKVSIDKDFHICQQCRYGLGFHLSFIPSKDSGKFQMILICPSCGARYDMGLMLS